MLFTSPKNQLESDLKTKLNGKRFYKTSSFKYFCIQIDEELAWKQQINHVAIKLNKGNAMLSKLRHILHKRSQFLMQYLNPIYSMLPSFGHKTLIQSRDFTYNRKNLRMFSQSQNSYSGFLFNDSKIRKSFDKTALENCIFIRKYIKRLLTSVFNSRFKFSPKYHSYGARWADLGYFKIPIYRTKTYGKYSINANAIYVSNHLQSCHQMLCFIN